MTPYQKHLKAIGMDVEAVRWCGKRTPRQFWDEAPNGIWLTAYMRTLGVNTGLLDHARTIRQSAWGNTYYGLSGPGSEMLADRASADAVRRVVKLNWP